ncbi:MAG: glycosyltransferase family 4 protein [candidate division KSB1 bacterium]|nr:glycosyltransferase family 4 protein [candidate division KSB1 bacterium]
MSRRKGVHDLLAAAVQLKKNWTDFTVYLMGPGDQRSVQDMITGHALETHVNCLGVLNATEKWKYYHKAWCFCLPSYAEGFPLVLLEAMAAGLPIVSSRAGGIPDMIDDCRHGYLLNPGDVQGIAASIDTVWKEPARREKMAALNRQRVKRNYTIERCADKISQLYQELLH